MVVFGGGVLFLPEVLLLKGDGVPIFLADAHAY